MMDVRGMLSPEERDEYDALIEDALYDGAGMRPSALIGPRLYELLDDAEQAGRPWAGWAKQGAACDGLLSLAKRHDKRLNRIRVYDRDTDSFITKSERRGVRQVDQSTGAMVYQQQSLWLMSRDELDDVERGAKSRTEAERQTLWTVQRLRALLDRSPAAVTALDAAANLHIDPDEYLAERAA